MNSGPPPLKLLPLKLPHISRRRLLAGAAAGGGLLVAWELTPRHYPLPVPPGEGEVAFGAWLRIDTRGVVTVAVPQLEMGQGITTLLPQIVAMELGADWRMVAAEQMPVSAIFANAPLAARWAELWMPLAPALEESLDGWFARHWAERHRFTATADGTSLAAYEAPAREAAAAARAMLAMAAADRWDVDWRQCEVADGWVRQGKQRLSFAALAEDAAKKRPPSPVPLRAEAPAEEPVALPVGVAPRFARLDLPAKVRGAWQFAADARLPDMLHAAIRHAPVGKAALAGHDGKRARGVAGFRQLVAGNDWLAAVADDWWAAERALTLVAPRFAVQQPADSVAMEAALDKALRQGDGHDIVALGDARGVLGANPSFTRRYEVAPALHAPLETACATARIRKSGWFGEKVEIWVASQAPEETRRAVAGALGVSLVDVILYPMAAGGSFDARLECPHAVEAALIAREVGHPVQLTWSRWQEHVAGVARPPAAAVLSARCDPAGAVVAWKARAALPASAREFGRRLFHGDSRAEAMEQAGRDADPLALEGAVPPYAIANLSVEHVPVAVGLPTGRMRGNAHGYTAFFNESFIDELAASLSREPLSFRMAMLEGDPRLAQCLQRVSALSDWNGGHDNSGQGLACHRIGTVKNGGCIAAVATARRSEEGVRVDRVTAVADIGRIVNADIARQQIEGGLVYGIGLALGASTTYARGLPMARGLAQLTLPVLANCPEIVVEFIAGDAPPADPGELGVAVAAPAIANALFSATGVRFRRLPLASEE